MPAGNISNPRTDNKMVFCKISVLTRQLETFSMLEQIIKTSFLGNVCSYLPAGNIFNAEQIPDFQLETSKVFRIDHYKDAL